MTHITAQNALRMLLITLDNKWRPIMTKKIHQSKTIIVNIIALIVIIIQMQTGFIISIAEQTAILTVINIFLRLITKEPISL